MSIDSECESFPLIFLLPRAMHDEKPLVMRFVFSLVEKKNCASRDLRCCHSTTSRLSLSCLRRRLFGCSSFAKSIRPTTTGVTCRPLRRPFSKHSTCLLGIRCAHPNGTTLFGMMPLWPTTTTMMMVIMMRPLQPDSGSFCSGRRN